MNKTVLTSASVGAVTGGVIGGATSPARESKHIALGAVTGAVISGIAGYFIHKGVEKRDEDTRRKTLFNLDKYDVSTPPGFGFSSAHGLTAPKIESEWVPTRVEGKKLVEGHKIWVITDEPQWVPGHKLKKNKGKK